MVVTFGYNIILNGQEPKRLEEFSEEMQEKIRKATYSQLVQALGYQKEESA